MEERLDLTKYMKNKDNPDGKNRELYLSGWSAGDQLEALRFYLNNNVLILSKYQEDDYQGECFAILQVENIIVLWRDSFGSCSGCDALEDQNGYEYIKNTLQEGNTRQFETLNDAKSYINNTSDWFWKSFNKDLFNGVLK